MPLPPYVTSAGLQIPTVEDLVAELTAEQRANIDPNLPPDPDDPLVELNGIFASHLREAWEVVGAVFNALDPDQAEGPLLETVASLTGTFREPATRSTFKGTRKLTVNLDDGTTLPIGTVFHVDGDETARFVTTEQILAAAGDGDYQVAAESEAEGPIVANAGTLTVIATPVVGLNSVTNDFDAILGELADDDPELRTRREGELRAPGSGTLEAMRSDVLAIEAEDQTKPVISASVLENYSNGPDVNGLPAKSFEILVYDGIVPEASDDAIAQAIWDGKPAGIEPFGNTSGSAIDGEGNTQIVPFSRPTITTVRIDTLLEVRPEYAGDDAVKEAMLATFLTKVRPGSKMRWVDYATAARSVLGVVDILELKIYADGSGVPSPDFESYNLAIREMADLQTTTITIVTEAAEEP